ncbi:hypothetical protein CMV_015567 [Castanea mollissima]|uniref:pectinesterase n=1 Tax=Castanea mollissima TaxID=60419 RepID=A0A8J4RAB9_9ROSI|nr:hypothetical protein CMV_015567 [Castanea mollissima]
MSRLDEEVKQDEMLGNMIVLGVSLVIIAAVVIAVIAGVDNPKEATSLSNKNITLAALCNETDYKESCMSSLESVGNQTEVLIYFKGAVNATIYEMEDVVKIARQVDIALKQEKMALEDCIELVELCLDELKFVVTMVNATPSLFFNDSSDARTSLSAVLSYQRACIEGMQEASSTFDMERALQKSTELTSNSLAIVHAFSVNDDKGAESSGMSRKLISNHSFDIKIAQAPDAVVAKDGSGKYKSINDAINAYPDGHNGRYLIYVKSGTYRENVIIPKNKTKIFMYGDGMNNTIITGVAVNGTTYRNAALSAIGNGFICKDVGIIVDTSRRSLLAAVKVQSDNAAFFNCRINATKLSIYALAHRQFFRDCEIYGDTNIIRGDSAVVFQSCKIIVTKPFGSKVTIIAAQARSDRRESTGFVLHNCNIDGDKSLFPKGLNNVTYLGMPMQKYSRIIVMESILGDLITPEGWFNNNETYGIETVTFVEYGNKGIGAQTNKRVKWPGYNITYNKNDVLRYTVGRFIQAQKWLPATGVTFQAGLFS